MLISAIAIKKDIGHICKISRGHYAIGTDGMFGDFHGDYATRHEAVEALRNEVETPPSLDAADPEICPWKRKAPKYSTTECWVCGLNIPRHLRGAGTCPVMGLIRENRKLREGKI